MDYLPVQSTPVVRCPVSFHSCSTKIQMKDSYYCMMIGPDHSEVGPHCQAGTSGPRRLLGARREAMRIVDSPLTSRVRTSSTVTGRAEWHEQATGRAQRSR